MAIVGDEETMRKLSSCEWNPVLHCEALWEERETDCRNEAVFLVSPLHLCESCADLPEFAGLERKRLH
jgi:hypothetical protein